MQTRPDQPPVMKKPEDNLVTIQRRNNPEETAIQGSQHWSEGRKKFLKHHQEKYLQRLAQLREALFKEKDLVRLSLPKDCDKQTGFWEVIMADLEESSSHHKFPGGKTQRTYYAPVGGRLNSEMNRRAHLERLRRIRIMQMRRKLPPQLEPLHGVGLGSTKNDKVMMQAKSMHIQPSAYHVDWMRGNQMITPIADQEKAVSSWSLKHLRLLNTDPLDSFPHDIRTLLRRTKPLTPTSSKQEPHIREGKSNSAIPANSSSTNQKRKPSASTATTRSATTYRSEHQVTPQSDHSFPLRIESLSNPEHELPPTTTTPFMTEIVSHHSSSSSSRMENGKDSSDNDVKSVSKKIEEGEEPRPNLVDRACSPIGFRLPNIESPSRASVSSSANSKRHIIVKIPDGIA